jgi:hypothetical protein
MGTDQYGLTPSQRIRLEQLAARLVLVDGFYPEAAVRTAAELVAEGIDVDGLVQPASQPADLKVTDSHQVEILFRSALAEVGLQPPSREAAGWTVARWIAASIVGRVIPPGVGALRLWNLSSECGDPAELVEMLQLHDEWESSVGPDRAAVEVEILGFAPEVIAAADRHLAAQRPSKSESAVPAA